MLYIGMSQSCHCSLEYQSEIKKKKKSKYSSNTINSVSENEEDIILAIKSLLQYKL